MAVKPSKDYVSLAVRLNRCKDPDQLILIRRDMDAAQLTRDEQISLIYTFSCVLADLTNALPGDVIDAEYELIPN